MKNIGIIVIMISLLLATGCSTIQSGNVQSGSSTALKTSLLVKPNEGNAINEQKTMEDNGISCAISIDKLEFDPNTQINPNVPHLLNVYVTLENKGSQAVGLICFSTITDYAGVSATGIGMGNNDLLYPENKQSIHDKILIYNQQYSAISSKNSKLGISCMSSSPFAKPYTINLKSSWDLSPSDFH